MSSTAGRNHEDGPILVTGGTGTLGRLVLPRLQDAGCKVRVLSRSSREDGEGVEFVTGDLATGEGSKPRWRGPRSSCTARAAARATRARPGTWSGQRRGPGRGTWCTSRSSAPT